MLVDGAVISTDARVAAVMTNVVLAVAVPPSVRLDVAVIVVVPAFCPAAKPALDMVATLVLELAQLVFALMSVVESSVYLASAWNVILSPPATVGLSGVMVRTVNSAPVTVRVALPLTLSAVADIVVVPTALLVASPAPPIVATVVVELDHATALVRSTLESSEYVPVAVN